MSGNQTIVAAGGAGLLLVNYWTGPDRKTINDGLFNSSGDVGAAHHALIRYAAAAAAVLVATLLAGISDSWGGAMVAVIVALFILWAINHYAGSKK